MIAPALLCLLRVALGIQAFLCFHMNFRINCSISVKNVIEILMVIALNLRSLLVLEPFKHWFCHFRIKGSFYSFQFSLEGTFTSLVEFASRYFWGYFEWDCFLIYFQHVHYWYMGKLLIFKCCFNILLLWQKIWSDLSFWWIH
jgi:hypothetical protein